VNLYWLLRIFQEFLAELEKQLSDPPNMSIAKPFLMFVRTASVVNFIRASFTMLLLLLLNYDIPIVNLFASQSNYLKMYSAYCVNQDHSIQCYFTFTKACYSLCYLSFRIL
jgi:hypothetical protein